MVKNKQEDVKSRPMEYWVVSYYLFTPIENPLLEVARHKAFLFNLDIKARIYLSHEGINGQMSGKISSAKKYIEWLSADPRFSAIDFKIQLHDEHCFPRLTVKCRPELVAIGSPLNQGRRGDYLTPREWKERLKNRDEKTVLIDVRNDYEWKVGHFEGALLPALKHFREFPSFLKNFKVDSHDKTVDLLLYCTAGIRCELYSAFLYNEGYKNVYQLKGGVVQYGIEEGSTYWRGKLFVFDDRLSVSIDKNSPGEVISQCQFCETKSDFYFNCANSRCNALYLACLPCSENRQGCCSPLCQEAPDRRTFQVTAKPKPFRRKTYTQVS